jgi:polyisoprenoid-binding protein YceI
MTTLRSSLYVLAGLSLVTPLRAQEPVPSGTVREGTLSFDGHATAGDFVGTTTTVTGEMTGAPTLPEVRGWVEAPVATLKTGNDHRDRDLNKSMESDKYPTMRFELAEVVPSGTATDSLDAVLRGQMTIHGVTRPVEIPASVVFQGGTARVRGSFPLNLKQYKIGGLSKMLGILKMYEDIVIHVDLTFSSQ